MFILSLAIAKFCWTIHVYQYPERSAGAFVQKQKYRTTGRCVNWKSGFIRKSDKKPMFANMHAGHAVGR
jgi:hypothetical protein